MIFAPDGVPGIIASAQCQWVCPAFLQSPVYKETKEFYEAYKQVEEYLQEVRTTADPKIGSGFWYAKEEAKKLDNLATQLMIQNPAFSRMYYGVFSSLVKVG
jgi:hypothetical protein